MVQQDTSPDQEVTHHVIQKRKIIQSERCALNAIFGTFHICEIWVLTGLLTYKRYRYP